MKKLLSLSAFVSLCAVVGCGSPDRLSTSNREAIENYRKMDLPRPANERVPERYVDPVFHFSYERPDAKIEGFHSAWKMTKTTSSASHGVFVLRADEVDPNIVRAGIFTNIAGETDDVAARLAQFKRGFNPASGLVSYEELTINGRPAALAQYRMINPLDTFMMYQCLIPDSNRSLSILGFAPAREFSTYKAALRKTILSTKLTPMPRRMRDDLQNGEGC
jgi:hypothetical protein